MKTEIHENLFKSTNRVMAKLVRIKSMRIVANMSFVLLLLTAACGQSEQ